MIVAAAFCPAPPLLHPQALPSDGHDAISLVRRACRQGLDRILATEPEGVLVIGAAPAAAVYGPGDAGDLLGYGIDVRLSFAGPPTSGAAGLPMPHALGAWLLDEAGFAGERLGLPADSMAAQGASALVRGRWAMLVMGDGSACRTEQSPGWYEPDAIPFDDVVTASLAEGEAKPLLELDEAVGARVLASGTTAWRTAGQILLGTTVDAHLHYADAPFGVCYLVASWVAGDQP